MGQTPTKAAGNIYCNARKKAAMYNDKLNSREGAAEMLGCSPSTLADYELGITKVIPVDSIVRMADLYNAPELRNHYCANECPIGQRCIPTLEVAELDRLTIKVLATLKKVSYIKDTLIDITADGQITNDEVSEFHNILSALDAISQGAQELKLWAEKSLKGVK